MRLKKMNRIIVLLALFVTSCGDGNSRTEESNNLFLKSGNQTVEENVDALMTGLWESEEFTIDDFTYTLRWEVSANGTVLAKRCTDEAGRNWYVQVSLPYADVASQATIDNMTPYNIPADDTEKVVSVVQMTGNKPCRVSLDPTLNASLVETDDDVLNLGDDNFQTGEMVITTIGQPAQIVLTKIQNR